MKAVLRRVAKTKGHWIIACHATMEPFEFKLGGWQNEARTHVEALAGGFSTHHAMGA